MSDFKPTAEQAAIIDTAKSGQTFVVDATAGSGKSTTARQITEVLNGRTLYLVYNRSASDDAKAAMKHNRQVVVKTTSALALQHHPEYKDRMIGAPRVPARDTAKLAGITHSLDLGEDRVIPPAMIARLAREAIDKFCYSADPVVLPRHVKAPEGMDLGQVDALRNHVAKWANKIWNQAIALESKHWFSFDYAFKLLVHQSKDLGFDTVIVDEAQDSNPAAEKLVKDQKGSQLIVIGDPAQAIYGWRGAVNIMDRFEGPRLTLSKSWRFGPDVADEAAKWLNFTGTNIKIVGNEALHSTVGDHDLSNPDAVLCRTNGGVISRAMEYLDQGVKVGIVGGTSSLVNLAYAAMKLQSGKQSDHPELAAFNTWQELVAFTEEPGGGDLKAFVQLIHTHGAGTIIDACGEMGDAVPPAAAWKRRTWTKPDVALSTAHKVKGLEWDNVQIGPDFATSEPDSNESPVVIDPSDAMLHYVAVTRARKHLDRGGLAWIDNYVVLANAV